MELLKRIIELLNLASHPAFDDTREQVRAEAYKAIEELKKVKGKKNEKT